MTELLKRTFICAAILAALLLCACGRTEEAATETTAEPATAPPVTDAPTTEAPEPETVISYDFHLEKLPDIGTYKAKKNDCFYDAPLKEFRTSDGYGTLIPYRLSGKETAVGQLDRWGFMTADGKIVTDSIYESISEIDLNGSTVYCAKKKVFAGDPVTIPDWETDPEGAQAAYERAGEYYDQNLSYQLITADGSRCLTVPSNPTGFSYTATGVSMICCAKYRNSGEYFPDGCVSFLVYDADLNLTADLTEDLQDCGYSMIFAADEDTIVVRCQTHDEDIDNITSRLLFFEDGELDRTLEFQEEYPYRIEGEFVVTSKRVCDGDGRTVYEYGDAQTEASCDPRNGCLFLYNASKGELFKTDRRGSVLARAQTDILDRADLTRFDTGSGSYYVVPRSSDGANRNGYRVYDGDLHQVCDVGGEAVKNDFCCAYDTGAPGVFLVADAGRTKILDITGNTVASVPFVYTGYEINYDRAGKDLVYLFRSNERCAVFSAEDRSVRVIPGVRDTPEYPYYFSMNYLVRSEAFREQDFEWRYVVLDCATGKRLLDDLTAFHAHHVNGKTWYNYIRNDTLYVCDEDLNVIAALYDDLFV